MTADPLDADDSLETDPLRAKWYDESAGEMEQDFMLLCDEVDRLRAALASTEATPPALCDDCKHTVRSASTEAPDKWHTLPEGWEVRFRHHWYCSCDRARPASACPRRIPFLVPADTPPEEGIDPRPDDLDAIRAEGRRLLKRATERGWWDADLKALAMFMEDHADVLLAPTLTKEERRSRDQAWHWVSDAALANRGVPAKVVSEVLVALDRLSGSGEQP